MIRFAECPRIEKPGMATFVVPPSTSPPGSCVIYVTLLRPPQPMPVGAPLPATSPPRAVPTRPAWPVAGPRGRASRRSRRRSRPLTGFGVSTAVHVVALLVLGLIVSGVEAMQRPPLRLVTEPAEPEIDVADLLPLELEAAEPEAPGADVPDVDAAKLADVADAAIDVPPPELALDVSPTPLETGSIALDGLAAEVRVVGGHRGGGAGPGDGGFGGAVDRRLARAGARSGAIQVSLSWDNFNDVDLHVVAPSGEHVFFGHPRTMCGGHLDVDMNAGGPMSREPVENVYWPARLAPFGTYRIFVHHFARHDPVDETAFEVHVLVDGVRTRHTGAVRSGTPAVLVAEFVRRPPARGRPASEEFRE